MTWRILAAALLVTFIGALLTEIGFKGKRAVTGLAIILFSLCVIDGVSGMLSEIMEIADAAGITDAARCALKVVGVGYAFGITSDIAEELGEKGIAGAVTSIGRVEIFLIVFPYFKEILDVGIGLLK